MSFHTLAHKLTELKRLAPPCCPSGPTSPLAPQGHGRHSPALAEGNDDRGLGSADRPGEARAEGSFSYASVRLRAGLGPGAALIPAGRAGGGRDPAPPHRFLTATKQEQLRRFSSLPFSFLPPPSARNQPPPSPVQPGPAPPHRSARRPHPGFPRPRRPRTGSRGGELHMRRPAPSRAVPDTAQARSPYACALGRRSALPLLRARWRGKGRAACEERGWVVRRGGRSCCGGRPGVSQG